MISKERWWVCTNARCKKEYRDEAGEGLAPNALKDETGHFYCNDCMRPLMKRSAKR